MLARFFVISLAVGSSLLAESGTTSIRFAGVQADGGRDCSSCHSTFGAANSDSRNGVTIDVVDYNPGVAQTIHVTVAHPLASAWGFQLTARPVSDETQQAGTFTPLDDRVQVRCDDGSKFGFLSSSATPCAGAREFAEHVVAPRTAAGAGFTFDVRWLPPANEVGDVRLYASAVAANGDGTAAGDRVYTAVRTLTAVGACNFTQKPTLRTAVNGASFQPGFSSQSLLSIFGLGFQVPGRTRVVGSGDIVLGQFPTQLACVAVEINNQRVPIAYIQQDQINVQAPVLPASGPVNLVVILNPGKPNEIRSDIATLTQLQTFAPAFFTLDGNQIAAQFANTSTLAADPSSIPGARAVKSGDILTLYGTGFGDTVPHEPSGLQAPSIAALTTPVSVLIGSTTLSQADVLYAGLSPGSISGLYQINVRVPAGLPSGKLPVLVRIGGLQSPDGVSIFVQNPL